MLFDKNMLFEEIIVLLLTLTMRENQLKHNISDNLPFI